MSATLPVTKCHEVIELSRCAAEKEATSDTVA